MLPDERSHNHLPSSKGTDHKSEKCFALAANLQEIQRTEEPGELYQKDTISKIQLRQLDNKKTKDLVFSKNKQKKNKQNTARVFWFVFVFQYCLFLEIHIEMVRMK